MESDSFKAQNIVVQDRVYTVRISKAMAVKIPSFGLVFIYGIKPYVSYTCISMTKPLIWSCEKMIHAYASIWRCLMHDIIIEIREKTCVHVHHLEISTQAFLGWKWKQLSASI